MEGLGEDLKMSTWELRGEKMTETKERLEELAKMILDKAKQMGADHAHVNIFTSEDIGTRFGENHITQNVYETSTGFFLKTQIGQKVSGYQGSNPNERNIDSMLEDALLLTKKSEDDTEFPGFISDQMEFPDLKVPINDFDPEDIASGVQSIVETAKNTDSKISAVAGNLRFVKSHLLMMNTNGVSGYRGNSWLTSVINVAATEGTGESRSTGRIAGRTIDALKLPEEAEQIASRAVKGLNQQEMEIGAYEAVLSPLAFSALWFFVAFATSSEGLITHSSFLKDKLGEQIFDSRLTAIDDTLNPDHLGARNFDSELVATNPIVYIEEGVLKDFAYNLRNAKKLGVESNGRNFQGFQGEMPLFTATTIKTGSKSEEDLIASVDDGIYISNLFYNNFVNPPQGICTGLTRDGLFRIKNGEIVHSLKNFRWTDSLQAIFKDTEPGNNPKQVAGFFGGSAILPSIRVSHFNLSSKGKH
ncbi:MAG: TldD/PmbA family protein [Methanobacteriota archaeon]|nr:MAG: TldD/PmbA family protein [Euryarchaeota archaeon]